MRRKGSEIITRLVTIAILSALGFVLMAFARIPYPIAPWLKIEFSEVTVLIGYALYGFPGGIAVAIIKTALDLAVHGLTDPLGIGHITALLTSLLFVLGLFLCSHVFKFFKKGLGFRVIAYLIITVLVSTMMTGLNAIVITPSYLSAYSDGRYTTCFNEGVIEEVISFFHKNNAGVNVSSYIGLMSLVYMPFNLIKAASCCIIYELIFNRLIFVFMQRSPKMKKYFVGNIFKSEEKEIVKEDSESDEEDEKDEDEEVDIEE